jgi:hypothetical protein
VTHEQVAVKPDVVAVPVDALHLPAERDHLAAVPEEVQVRAADPARLDLDQDLSEPRHRVGHLVDQQGAATHHRSAHSFPAVLGSPTIDTRHIDTRH